MCHHRSHVQRWTWMNTQHVRKEHWMRKSSGSRATTETKRSRSWQAGYCQFMRCAAGRTKGIHRVQLQRRGVNDLRRNGLCHWVNISPRNRYAMRGRHRCRSDIFESL